MDQKPEEQKFEIEKNTAIHFIYGELKGKCIDSSFTDLIAGDDQEKCIKAVTEFFHLPKEEQEQVIDFALDEDLPYWEQVDADNLLHQIIWINSSPETKAWLLPKLTKYYPEMINCFKKENTAMHFIYGEKDLEHGHEEIKQQDGQDIVTGFTNLLHHTHNMHYAARQLFKNLSIPEQRIVIHYALKINPYWEIKTLSHRHPAHFFFLRHSSPKKEQRMWLINKLWEQDPRIINRVFESLGHSGNYRLFNVLRQNIIDFYERITPPPAHVEHTDSCLQLANKI